MSQKSPSELISPEEIRAVSARGEEAVIELVEGLVEKLGKLAERVEECHECGASLAIEPVQTVWARQGYDIPPIELKVYEHRAEVKKLSALQLRTFPL